MVIRGGSWGQGHLGASPVFHSQMWRHSDGKLFHWGEIRRQDDTNRTTLREAIPKTSLPFLHTVQMGSPILKLEMKLTSFNKMY